MVISEPHQQPADGGSAPAVVGIWHLDSQCADPVATAQSIASQDYPNFNVLVCHESDVEIGAIQRVLPNASFLIVEPQQTPSQVLNTAVANIEGAPFLCAIHGSAVLDAPAVRILVEEAFRSNAAIVGPKFLSGDGSRRLVDVGWYVDRTGHPYSGIETDEVDQEQRDGVRDVFFVAHNVMLIRRDLWDEIGPFEPRCEPGAAELDYCWRARVAGARVMVAPDARVAFTGNTVDRHALSFPIARTRSLVRNASWWSLCWAIPAGITLAIAEAAGLFLTRKPKRALVTLRSWFGVLASPASWTGRRGVQRHRRIRDAELRFVQIRGSARVREFLERYHADDRLASASDATRAAASNLLDLVRQPLAYGWIAFVGLVGFGSRRLFEQGYPAIGEMLPWPGAGALADAFTSPWRYTGLGAERPGSPALAVMSLWTTVTGGNGARAATTFLVVVWVLGAIGAFRLIRPFDRTPLAALVGGLAYGINPLVLHLMSEGRLQTMVLYGGAPWLWRAVVRAGSHSGAARLRAVVVGSMVLALVGSFQPLAFMMLPIMVLAWLMTLPLGGGPGFVFRSIANTVGISVVAIALVFPWPLAYLRKGIDLSVLGLVRRPETSVGDIFAFGASVPFAGWALLAAAVLPLFVAERERLTWAVRAWVMIMVGAAVAWVGPRIGEIPWPASEVTGVIIAVAAAFAIGLGVGAIRDELQSATFGWRQVLSGGSLTALAAVAVIFVGSSFDGGWGAPSSSWQIATGNFEYDTEPGEFRVLWLSPSELGHGPALISESETSITLTRNGVGDARDLLPAAAGVPEKILRAALREARVGETNRLGELLGPMGIRYIAVIDRAHPDADPVPFDSGWRQAFDTQLDFKALRVAPGMSLYENSQWVPVMASFSEEYAAAVRDGIDAFDPLRAASELVGSVPQPFPESKVMPDGVVVVAEANDPGWRTNNEGAERSAAYGWANVFSGPAASVQFEGDGRWTIARGIGAASWALVVLALIVIRTREVAE